MVFKDREQMSMQTNPNPKKTKPKSEQKSNPKTMTGKATGKNLANLILLTFEKFDVQTEAFLHPCQQPLESTEGW